MKKLITKTLVIATMAFSLTGCIKIVTTSSDNAVSTSVSEETSISNSVESSESLIKTSKSYSIHLDNGDDIEVSMDTSGDWSLRQDSGVLTIKNYAEAVMQGIFLDEEMYEATMDAIEASGDSIEILEESSKDGNDYIFVNLMDEYDYIIHIGNSNTWVQIATVKGEEIAREAFEKLTFKEI